MIIENRGIMRYLSQLPVSPASLGNLVLIHPEIERILAYFSVTNLKFPFVKKMLKNRPSTAATCE